MNNVIQFLVKMNAESGSVVSVAERVKGELDKINERAKSLRVTLKQAFSAESFSNALMSTPGMQLLLNPYTMIAAGVGAVAKLGAEAEATAQSFTTLVGSEQKANGLLKEIGQFASDTPFNKMELTRNAEKMMNFGVESNKVMGYLKQLGDISGGNSDRFASLSLALGQVNSAGQLMGQELLQFIGAGFNPLQELSKMTGKSYIELKKMMEEGKISSENVAQAIAHATGEGGKFHGMLDRLKNTISVQWSQAVGKMQTFAVELFEYLKPVLQQAFAIFNALLPPITSAIKTVFSIIAWGINFIVEWKDELMLLAGIIGVVITAMSASNIVFGVMLGLVKAIAIAERVVAIVSQGWVAVQTMLNAVLSMNPIGLVIMAIGALVAIGIYCWNKFAGFRAFLLTMWDTMKGFGNVIKTYVVNRINELLGAVGNVGKALKLLFTGDFDGAKNAAGEAIKQFSGANSTATAVAGAKNVANGIGNSWANNLAEENRKQASKGKQKSGISTPALAGSAPIGEVVFGSGGVDGKSGKRGGRAGKNSKSTDAIATGGQRNTSITMTIGKFFDAINVHMMDKTDTSELQRIILETLNRSLAIATSADR